MRDIYDYVGIFRGVMTHDEADEIVTNLQQGYDWQDHLWGQSTGGRGQEVVYKDGISYNSDTEFSVAWPPDGDPSSPIIHKAINAALARYTKKWPLSNPRAVNSIRFNKYDTNTRMRGHVDHIHNLFEGDRRGIPILSIVGLLNDDFEGGQFVFNGHRQPDLEKGDVLIFPSNFIYQHKVQLVTSGTRYSWVTWAF
jgi:hypothetical protein